MIAGMVERNSEDLAEVIDKELALLQPGLRSNPEAVLGMLHESFREFGASGRAWDRDEIAAELAEAPGPGATAQDMRAVRLSDDVVLLTYVARRPDRLSLRSSLWVRGDDGWRLFFHQGTPCP